jgi:hypothetical protein
MLRGSNVFKILPHIVEIKIITLVEDIMENSTGLVDRKS